MFQVVMGVVIAMVSSRVMRLAVLYHTPVLIAQMENDVVGGRNVRERMSVLKVVVNRMNNVAPKRQKVNVVIVTMIQNNQNQNSVVMRMICRLMSVVAR